MEEEDGEGEGKHSGMSLNYGGILASFRFKVIGDES